MDFPREWVVQGSRGPIVLDLLALVRCNVRIDDHFRVALGGSNLGAGHLPLQPWWCLLRWNMATSG